MGQDQQLQPTVSISSSRDNTIQWLYFYLCPKQPGLNLLSSRWSVPCLSCCACPVRSSTLRQLLVDVTCTSAQRPQAWINTATVYAPRLPIVTRFPLLAACRSPRRDYLPLAEFPPALSPRPESKHRTRYSRGSSNSGGPKERPVFIAYSPALLFGFVFTASSLPSSLMASKPCSLFFKAGPKLLTWLSWPFPKALPT